MRHSCDMSLDLYNGYFRGVLLIVENYLLNFVEFIDYLSYYSVDAAFSHSRFETYQVVLKDLA